MTKHPVFDWKDCWGCGEPLMENGPFTVSCPGCDPDALRCENEAKRGSVRRGEARPGEVGQGKVYRCIDGRR